MSVKRTALNTKNFRLLHTGGLRPFATSLLLLALAACFAVSALGGAALAQALSGRAAIDMEFDDAPVVQVVQSVAAMAGLNVLIDPAVSGRITVSLRQVDLEEALDLIMAVAGLQYELRGNTLVVTAGEAPAAAVDRGRLVVHALQHAPLERARELVAALYPRIAAVADAQAGALILQGPSRDVESALEFLAEYDRPQGVSLSYRREPVETVLWELSALAGWNLVIDGELSETITARLDGMPYEDALAQVAAAAGLDYQLVGNVLTVRSGRTEEPNLRRIAVRRLDHVNPARAAEVLAAMYPEAQIRADEAWRQVIIDAPSGTVESVLELLEELDQPRRQVVVEARFEEIRSDALRQLGVVWQLPTLRGSGTAATVTLNWDPAELIAALDALEREGKTKLLASPRLAAVEDHAADILIGERIPIVVESRDSDGQVSQSVEFIEAGIRLELIPSVDRDDYITLDIFTEVSSVTQWTSAGLPELRTREVRTRVRVRDGQPLVIGGLVEESQQAEEESLPFLGELPLVGGLFGREKTEGSQSEMVIFLIPHIVEPEQRAATGGASEEFSGAAPRSVQTETAVDALPGEATAAGRAGSALGGEKAGTVESRAFVDLVRALNSVVDVQLENAKESYGTLTRLYAHVDEKNQVTWGLGIGRRYFGRPLDSYGTRPWAGVVLERLQAPGERGRFVLDLSAGILANFEQASPKIGVELFASYGHVFGDASTFDVPGRRAGLSGGIRLGWRY